MPLHSRSAAARAPGKLTGSRERGGCDLVTAGHCRVSLPSVPLLDPQISEQRLPVLPPEFKKPLRRKVVLVLDRDSEVV